MRVRQCAKEDTCAGCLRLQVLDKLLRNTVIADVRALGHS